jgi:hypothetical protein
MLIGGPATTTGTGVTGAIQNAARATGTSFQYLLATARVESGLNPQASAKTSSARGLFQFVDRTWLATLKQAGSSLGYGRYADAITQKANGQLEVQDPAMRQKISALRDDPTASAAMAGAFTHANSVQLGQALGRAPNDAELYMAHFLGARGAGKLISLASSNPNAAAASAFPRAADANRSIFFDRAGNARSVGDVYGLLAGRYDVARSGTANVVASAQTQPIAPTATTNVAPVANIASAAAPTFAAPRSLFSDINGNGRREPVASIIRELWSTRPQVAAALSGVAGPQSAGSSTQAVAPIGSADGLRGLYRDLPPSARGLFTTRS